MAQETSPLLGSPFDFRRHRPARVVDDDDDDDEEEQGGDENSPLLPIFSAAHLDALPVYNLIHTIRVLIVTRCETTLTWDQLRSPQVAQFLIKPIQQQIRTQHFSRATIYALMANCLQFGKESYENPGNSGTSRTRAFLAELLAIKLLREFTTRELIDALSYNFDPLQGYSGDFEKKTRTARVSTLEVAIRAQAKHLLAHPLVVRQLEAIWAGTIVFHSAADSYHRTSEGTGQSSTFERSIRRSVTLYDPQEASLLKLSRLRVPRYRQFLSTCSLAILLGLYLAVLVERSLHITLLEIVFWFWSAGFMLDEIVGFSDQGFSLYILSIWNAFDLGILLLLVVYYAMRIWGLLLIDEGKSRAANMAYDVLAANAVFLFPRLFSVLDHYRYFSQLLIAFRLMAVDLVACFILIIISCSGFFVAFTLSFGSANYDPKGVAYSLFQMLMGFTPAAWDTWDDYNILGKLILTLFLFICHFLIVTILITVLTNSFMAIVANANEEHQYVFAINVISTVKSDALFSYVAPTNILAWALAPLRYAVPFRQFVRINRTVIKVTHLPILFAIFAYEKLFLSRRIFDPIDLVESRGRSQPRIVVYEDQKASFNLFSPAPKIRNGSVASVRKDRALAEVFQRPYQLTGNRQTSEVRKKRRVDHWMQEMGSTGNVSPPAEDDPSMLDSLERRKLRLQRSQILQRRSTTRDFTDATRSVASDPEDFFSNPGDEARKRHVRGLPKMSIGEVLEETDVDDEGEREELTPASGNLPVRQLNRSASPVLERHPRPQIDDRTTSELTTRFERRPHTRNVSSATILHVPQSSSLGIHSNSASKATVAPTSARPIMPKRNGNMSVPNLTSYLRPRPQRRRRRSSTTFDLVSSADDEDGDNLDQAGGMPASFATQMAFATGALRPKPTARSAGAEEDARMMSRLMLARMKTLEEGLQDIIREVRGMSSSRRSSKDGSVVFVGSERRFRVSESGTGKGRAMGTDDDYDDNDQERMSRSKGETVPIVQS